MGFGFVKRFFTEDEEQFEDVATSPVEQADFDEPDEAPSEELGTEAQEEEAKVGVVRLTNPESVIDPPVFDLLRETLISNPISDARKAIPQVIQAMGLPGAGVLACREGDEWVAMSLVQVNTGLTDGAVVLHFFNKGSSRARKALVEAVLEFSRRSGAKRLFGFDVNGQLGGFKRLFNAGNPVKEYGQLVEFNIVEDG